MTQDSHHPTGAGDHGGPERPDPIAGIVEETRRRESEVRERDKMLGRTLHIGPAYFGATVLIALLAVALLLPHSEGVRGLDVLFYTQAAQDQYTSLPSRLFVTLYSVGTIGFGALMILTQKWWAAGIAWALTCVAAWYGVLAIWLRQSGRGPDPDATDFGAPGIGLYVSELLVVALAVLLALVLWVRSDEQRELEQQARQQGD